MAMARVGSAEPSTVPTETLSRWRTKAATETAASTTRGGNRLAKASAMSWLLSPISATKMTASAMKNAPTWSTEGTDQTWATSSSTGVTMPV